MALQQTITGELRKWQLQQPKGLNFGTVIGYMYHDTHDIWEDGEEAVIQFKDWVDSANFYLVVTTLGGCIKLPKEEERGPPEERNKKRTR